MLPTDADEQFRLNTPALLYSHFHQLAHAFAIQHGKGVLCQYFLLGVMMQELTLGIVTAESQSSLGQVIGQTELIRGNTNFSIIKNF